MQVELHQPFSFGAPGDVVDVDDGVGQFMLAEGYGSPAGAENPPDEFREGPPFQSSDEYRDVGRPDDFAGGDQADRPSRAELEDMTVEQLHDLARERDESGYSSLRKEELVDRLV